MDDPQQQFSTLAGSKGFRLAIQAAVHLGVWLLLFSAFAAADSWALLTGWSLATLLSVLTGLVAGFATVNLTHEWFHFLGAKFAAASYDVKTKPGLFVFDWNFQNNTKQQFHTMSIAGTLGSGFGVWLIWSATSPDNAGRIALAAGALASFAFAAIIEWPVLARTRQGGDPMTELGKISPAVLGRAAAGGAVAAVLYGVMLA